MNPDCLIEVQEAIGRPLKASEADAIKGEIVAQMRELARTDPAKWSQMTGEQKLRAASDAATKAALERAEVQAQRKARNLLVQTREAGRLTKRAAQLKARGSKQANHDAIFERLVQFENYHHGLHNEYLSQLMDTLSAMDGKFFGLFDDPEQVRGLARAVLDGDTTNPDMVKAAKALTDTMEALRLRQNAAGADIGRLDYSYLPQPHDAGKIARTGADQWAADVLPMLARDRYVRADGQPMDDAEVMDVLRSAWVTLATEGRNKLTPGATQGRGSRASRFDDAHRAIHFAGSDGYLAYMQKYGRGSMLEAINGHVAQATKNIALMEELGGNPQATFRLLKDMAEGVQGDNAAGKRAGWTAPATLDMTWDTLNGTLSQSVSARMAQWGQTTRSLTVATKLQGTLLSSVTDVPLQILVAKTSGVPFGQAMKSVFAGFGKDQRRVAHELALGVDEIAGEMSRWHDGNIGASWANKLASTTMKVSLMEAWTNGLRRGFSLTYSGALDRMRRKDWDRLDEFDRRQLEESGVTADDWAIWQLAEPTKVGDASLLTKEGLRGIDLEANGLRPADIDRATARLIGHVDALAKTAVLSPDLRVRAALLQGTKAGTFGGESLRMLMLFKSFPLAVVDKHLRRIRNIPTTRGKVAYSAAMMTSLTLFGAMALQLKDLAQGKDPRDMTTGKFWGAAFMQGGGMGIFGDVMYTGMGGNARGGQANWTSMAGPVFGTGMDLADVTLGNAARAAQGKDVDLGADLVRFGKGNTPFINLWYTRAAVDHLVLHDLQEAANPGYLRRMKQRSRKDWGQEWWWEPGENMPDRAPDLEAAAGGN
jgi:hypothetical protein